MTKTGQIKLFMVVAAALALGLLAMLAASPAQAAFPGKNGKIAFVSNRDTSGEIYTMKPDGSGTTRITFPTGGNSDPAFSPDGTKIAFKGANNDIYVMNANGMNPDGTGTQRLTSTASAEQEPAWSPDGSKIAYVANSFDVDGQTDPEIWVMNADGSGIPAMLTNNSWDDTDPAWSVPLPGAPDGKIAFESNRRELGDTDRNIYVMDTLDADGDGNGDNQTNVTPNSPLGCSSNCYQGHDDDPTWSPDGSKIAYVHGYGPPTNPFAGGGLPNIWTMDPTGSNKTNLSNNPGVSAVMPSYSPDSSKIAYVGAVDTNRDIWVMNSDGTAQMVLQANARNDISPDWQQDSIPPQTTITSGPPSITKGASASFSFVSSETGSTFECSLDGAAFTACSSPKSYSGLANGRHTFRVQATDAVGNLDLTPASRTWTVDTTPLPPRDTIKPTISGMSPRHKAVIRDTTPTIKATVRDNITNLSKNNITLYVVGKKISKRKFSYNRSTDRLVYNSPKLSKGKKMVKVVARDAAGNAGAKSWFFRIR